MARAAAYVPGPDFDLQPLDLSIRATREKHWPLQLDITEADQAGLSTTYVCDMASPDTRRGSPGRDLTRTNRHRPQAGLLSSLLSNADWTFYTGPQAASPNRGFGADRHRQSPYHLPARRAPELAEEAVSCHQSPDNTDQDLYTSYHQHSDSGVYSQLLTQSSLAASPQPPDSDNDHHADAMLQSSARAPYVKSSFDQSDNSPNTYSQWTTTETASPCHASPCHASPCHASPCHASPCQRNSEDVRNAGCDLYSRTQEPAAGRYTTPAALETQACLGHTAAHRYRHKTHQRPACPARYSPASPLTSLVSWPGQCCDPGSPDVVSSSSPDPWDLYSENPWSPLSSWRSAGGYQHSSRLLDQDTPLEGITQPQSSYPTAPRMNHPATPGPQSKYNTPGKTPRAYRSSSVTPSDCDHVSTSSDAAGLPNNRPGRHRDSPDAKLAHRSASGHVITTQASVLDFWISKFLWERSVGAASTRQPRHVEYIRSENGQKRIRFRLVDLIELQVEQSLRAERVCPSFENCDRFCLVT